MNWRDVSLSIVLMLWILTSILAGLYWTALSQIFFLIASIAWMIEEYKIEKGKKR